ncbi:MAG: ATP-binding protein, partial [Deltaproteobacteria bacterium]|nr:ATP-binding protein [Deltaproteobacteria bacterium]
RVTNRHDSEASIRGIDLQSRLEDGLPAVEAEQSLLERSVDNLLINALKFTPAGGRVVLSSGKRGNEVLVTVADTGPGIPSDDLEKIFDIGWRRSVDAKKEGSGLGLHIVKTMVHAIGGRLEVESIVGSGTHFSVSLPAVGVSRV